MRSIPFVPLFVVALLAPPASPAAAITPEQVKFFEGCWDGVG